VTLSGKRHYLGTHGTEEAKVLFDATVAQWLSNGRKNPTPPPDITVSELIAMWIRENAAFLKKSSSARCAIKTPNSVMIALYGSTLANEMTPLKMKAVRQVLLSKKFARITINKQIAYLARVFALGVENQCVDPSVHNALKCIKPLERNKTTAHEYNRIRPVPIKDVEATLPFLNKTLADMVQVQLLTGMRPGEVCGLKRAYFNCDGDVWTATLPTHKNSWRGLERVVYFGPEAQQILKPYFLRRKSNEYLFSPGDAFEGDPDRKLGACYTTQSYGRAIYRACLRADVLQWYPNRLRHTAGTECCKKYDLEAAGIMLGHHDPRATRVYAEPDNEKAIRIARAMG